MDRLMNRPLRKEIINALLGFILATLLFLSMQIVYWTAYPYNIVTIGEPIPILNENNEIAVGDSIQMRLVIDKKSSYRAEVHINITCASGNLVTMTPLGRTLPAGKFDIVNDAYTLPPKLAVGDVCQFNFLNFYQVNPIRTINKTWSSEPFKIIDRPDGV